MKRQSAKKILINRFTLIIPAILLQAGCTYAILEFIEPAKHILDIIMRTLGVIFVLYIISKPNDPSYKIMWLIIILLFPVLGAVLYLIFGNKYSGKPLRNSLDEARKLIGNPPADFEITESEKNSEKVKKDNLRVGQALSFIEKMSGFSLFENKSAKYYPSGEELFADYINDLKSAEKYIYIEFFIIEFGEMWDEILKIFQEKVSKGVDVRVIYDDLGCIGTLPGGYFKKLEKMGIKCHKFNPFIMALTGRLNNRSHRKITVIDGRVAYSGGINIGDEYINLIEKYGYWKDVGYRITGKGVDSFTYMFAEFWDAFREDTIPPEILKERNVDPEIPDGYILPYYDDPTAKYRISVMFFSEVLSQATDYAWFYTPYLMINDELYNEFLHAAERGVDVRIIMPGIPDKKVVFAISRSYYRDLMDAGVKIYEYEPGFVHAKACISDDIIGSVGSVNLDYRSLFLHFECNSIFYNASILKDIKADFEDTFTKCRKIKKSRDNNLLRALLRTVLKLFAPFC